MGLSLLQLSMSPKPCSGVPVTISLLPAWQAAVHPNVQPAPSPSHPSEVLGEAKTHLDFLEQRIIARPGEWERGYISSPWKHLMGRAYRTIM